MTIFNQVETNMDNLAEAGVWWADCATDEQILAAREGRLFLPLGIGTPVPQEWLGSLKGKNVLCLAGAGGLQGPLLAAAGANVTVLDLSGKMLEKDQKTAERHNLKLQLIHASMTEMSMFEDDSFDYIFNPVSLCYVPDVRPVFRKCHRILKKGGVLILAAPSPVNYLCDYIETEEGGCYMAVNRMPYISSDHPEQGDWIEFGHTMEDYLGGQTAAGFAITGYIEEQKEDVTELFFMTRAIRQ